MSGDDVILILKYLICSKHIEQIKYEADHHKDTPGTSIRYISLRLRNAREMQSCPQAGLEAGDGNPSWLPGEHLITCSG